MSSSFNTAIHFPDNLPISQRREEIAELIKANQVVILAGETGSGKTTQLPKICLSLGYGDKGLIGHTQPRRIAARTVADRIASELKSPLGDVVGYQVRFKDVSSKNTKIKLMTDGVLLAEFQRDRLLKRYEVIIIDEAHERSLNIDFLLGLLKPLCRKRPELKIIITSATIDLDKFANHFSTGDRPAPIIEVSGRTYPVETIYQAPENDKLALPDVITDTVSDLIRNESRQQGKVSGDVLVFCAGEREIRDTAYALNKAQLPIEVLPLYSRLSVKEQNRVFQSAHKRKVVLATNVAETSITVPGIAYVIDPGVARISRYSFRSKVQRLPIERISQASANQRQGRCGRVSNGVCIRLYAKEDFLARSEFTPAEILRSNLASVILKMLRLGINDLQRFDFIDAPDNRLINDGLKLLQELGAITKHRKLTKTGKQMSDLPIDPRYARILSAANELGCLRDAVILVSVLSVQDPRERPADKQQAADQTHQKIAHPQSDFFSYLHLWQAINNERSALSNTKFKQACADRHWSIARIFEWRELVGQMLSICKDLGWKIEPWASIELPKDGDKKPKASNNFAQRYELLHRAVLAGLLSNLANKDVEGNYQATRSRLVHIFPASSQAKRKPKWLVAASFLETSRLFAHTVGEIKPDWVIKVAQHLCRYTYSEPRYHARSGAVAALRKTLLYGLVLRDKERVNYGPINVSEARSVFIQQALVDGQYQPRSKNDWASFYSHNQTLISDIEKLEIKTRRRNLLASDATIADFYNAQIPQHIHNRTALEKWLKQMASEKGHANTLKLNRDELLLNQPNDNRTAQFPDHIEVHGKKITISYCFNPGQENDGITMQVPISVLAPFPEYLGGWLVPGMLREKCIALIKTLPKPIRRNFAPAADAVNRVIEQLNTSNTPLQTSLGEQLFRNRGIQIAADDWRPEKLDSYYQMNYRIIDVDGSLVDEGRDLKALKARYADSVQKSVHADHAPERVKLEHHDLSDWSFGELQESIEYQHQGMTVLAYPMLKIQQDQSVSLLMSDAPDTARYYSQLAIVQLALIKLTKEQRQRFLYLKKELFATKQKTASGSLADQLKHVKNNSLNGVSLSSDTGRKANWTDAIISAALQTVCFNDQIQTIATQQAFDAALNAGAKHWVSTAMEFETALASSLANRDAILANINTLNVSSVAMDIALEDIKAQLYRLFEPNFLRYTTLAQLKQYPRYLKAISHRVEKLSFASKHPADESALAKLQAQFDQQISTLQNQAGVNSLDFVFLSQPSLLTFHWMLQEWRLSIFAQHLKSKIPVSEKRLQKFWQTEVMGN